VNPRRSGPWLLIAIAVVAYPLVTLANGSPRFPSPAECVHTATTDGDLEVVFGRTDTAVEAEALLAQVLKVGFKGSQIEPDGCGRLKVAVHGISTLKVGAEVIEEAERVGIHATLEYVV
jgi:hypothetical protein